jgi:hypothetical protein
MFEVEVGKQLWQAINETGFCGLPQERKKAITAHCNDGCAESIVHQFAGNLSVEVAINTFSSGRH